MLKFKTLSGTAYLIANANTTTESTTPSISSNRTFEYSLDEGDTWTSWNGSSLEVNSTTGVCLRGTITSNGSSSLYTRLSFRNDASTTTKYSGKILTEGSISALNGDVDDITKTYCYQGMFNGCTSLQSAPQLPSTTLAQSCYSSMFSGCTSLQTAPELPSTTLAQSCYSGMFYNCTSLQSAPQLPATTLADSCYSSMFYNCTSLQSAPQLPATTLASSCYNSMFYQCYHLKIAPQLPATTLANECYIGMFYECRCLQSAPELPATTLKFKCYRSMFYNCTSLQSAPELPATTLADYCYYSMFSGCTSLQTASQLPATTLANNCYENMFYGCTSLQSAPELLATTLPTNCYNWMFSNCKRLKIIESETSIDESNIVLPKQTYSIGTGSLVDMFALTKRNFTGDPTPNNTHGYYCTNLPPTHVLNLPGLELYTEKIKEWTEEVLNNEVTELLEGEY